MKRNIFCSAIVFYFILVFMHDVWASPAEIEPVTKIQDIVIYPDGAMIKKEAAVAVKKGENIIRMSGLTPDLTDESVHINIKEKSAVRMSDVKVEKTYLQKTNQDNIQKLQLRVDGINELIKKSLNEISAINSAIEFLKKTVPFPQNHKVAQSEVESHAKFIEQSLLTQYERVARLEIKIKKLKEEEAAVENELKILNSQKDESKTIVINLFSNADREINLGVSYLVAKAGWSPEYDVRADSATGNIDISCFATIIQSAGEDWKNANIEISTARPSYSPPSELSAWYVDAYNPRPIARQYKKVARDTSMPMMSSEKASAMALEPGFEEAEIKEEATSFSFIIPGKVNIPSDNQPHRILIASMTKDAKLNYYTVPKLSPYVYLKADLKNPLLFPIISGRMNMFIDDRFVNTTSVDKQILPGDDLSLSLGIDEGIKIEKKLLKKFTGYTGVFSKDAQITYEYSIDVVSTKDRDIGINVSDNYPVSRNEQIQVTLESPNKNEAKISEDGIISWDLRLKPNEKKTLAIKFRVEYPKDLRITGL